MDEDRITNEQKLLLEIDKGKENQEKLNKEIERLKKHIEDEQIKQEKKSKLPDKKGIEEIDYKALYEDELEKV